MSDQISFVSKSPGTLGTLMGLFLWCWRHIIWIVIQILMSFQQLLLSEALIASIALKGFLIGVDQHMGFQMPLADTWVRTQITLEAFFTFMRLFVYFQGVAIRKGFSTHFTMQGSLGSMQFLHMQPQIRFSSTSGRTQFTLKNRFVSSMYQPVSF